MNRCLRICALLACAAAAVPAVDWSVLAPRGHVSDAARVTDPQTTAGLENYCAAVEAATGARIGLVTVGSLGGEPIKSVSESIFQAWSAGNPNTVLVLLVTRERRSRMEVGPGLRPHLPGNFAADVVGEMGPELRAKHYGQALVVAANAIGAQVASAKGLSPAVLPPLPSRHRHPVYIPWLALGVGLALAAWLGFLFGRGAGRFNTRGRTTWGGRGSGGFGSYDSGDSFAGFGGSDSGGRRTSGDW